MLLSRAYALLLVTLLTTVSACSGAKSTAGASALHGTARPALPATSGAEAHSNLPPPSPVQFVWASDGSPVMLLRPGAIAVGPQGEVLVCDCGHARVAELDAAGHVQSAWGTAGTGDGQFSFARGGRFGSSGALTVDQNGNIYVSDLSGRVQIFDAGGHFLRSLALQTSGTQRFRSPSGIAVDAQGDVYVVDAAAGDVQKFDSQGNLLVRWGGPGGNPGQFSGAAGIAIDSHSNVYVGDRRGGRIEKFDEDGNFLYEFNNSTTKGGARLDVQNIAIDKSDDLYVTNSSESRVIKYDRFGDVLGSWGGAGTGDGQFGQPGGITVDSNGNVYVVDTRAGRIEKFSCRTGGC
jgi:tripartite motif-containing protein 71